MIRAILVQLQFAFWVLVRQKKNTYTPHKQQATEDSFILNWHCTKKLNDRELIFTYISLPQIYAFLFTEVQSMVRNKKKCSNIFVFFLWLVEWQIEGLHEIMKTLQLVESSLFFKLLNIDITEDTCIMRTSFC